MVSKGIKLMFRIDHPTGANITHFDTRQIHDIIIEPVQPVENIASPTSLSRRNETDAGRQLAVLRQNGKLPSPQAVISN
jgi:hypothetical protein